MIEQYVKLPGKKAVRKEVASIPIGNAEIIEEETDERKLPRYLRKVDASV
jgi:hypothetical protein